MRARYLRAVLRQDMEYFDLRAAGSTSEVVTSVSSDSLVVQDALAEKVPSFVMNATMFAGSYAVGLAVLRRLTLAALPSVLLLVVPGIMYGRVLVGLARRIRAQYACPGAIAVQTVSSARTVYSFVAEKRTVDRFAAALEESVRLGLKQGLAKGVAVGSNGVTFAIWAFNVWYGSSLVMYHGYQGGTVFAISSIIVDGGLALGNALSNLKYFSEASSAAERVMEVIRRVPKIDSGNDDGEELIDFAGQVEFRNVQFCYPSRPESPVLVNFNLHVPAGRTVALVGGSGSGKSTVIALLERFYDPSAGEVALDGVGIRRLQLKWLRAQMGLVSQEPALFATSIRENVLFGKEDATAEEVSAAAKAADAHSFISQLPQGYDTQDGPRKESVRQSWYAGLGLGTSAGLMACSWALDFWYGGKLMAEHQITAKALFQTFMILVSTGRVIAEAGVQQALELKKLYLTELQVPVEALLPVFQNTQSLTFVVDNNGRENVANVMMASTIVKQGNEAANCFQCLFGNDVHEPKLENHFPIKAKDSSYLILASSLLPISSIDYYISIV
ncbi:hypothetical protein C2845_PM11G07610 [Panicum miliaceum]|uniref:ABC transmembrane type-1 domain-containing protein n=1 Tax=Panicum miliaceum TaxID=4540 RepID=A0A3L6RV46_PANMI|nr:hypothetical protein C2845_PM11G07610 [Panicum miliaceum]